VYRVKAIGTHELLHALADGDWTRLVPRGLVRADYLRVARRLYDPGDALDLPHLYRVSTALAGRVAGVDVDEGHDPQAGWWPAHRLAQFAVTHWLSFDGWCLRRGFNPWDATLPRIIAASWQFRIDTRPAEGAGDKAKPIDVEVLKQQVWTPPGAARKQVMKFTPAQEREAALAAIREIVPR
jgi:hypothetical protein